MTDEQIKSGYFRLTALEACVFTLTGKSDTPNISSIAYSLDEGSTWTSITVGTAGTSLPSLATGDSVILRGTLGAGTNNSYITISADGDFDAGGNIMSFIVGDNFSGVTAIPNYSNAVANLFQNNTHLIHASNMTFPATTLRWSCYRYMFDGCTALVSPPQTISATLYATYACQYMFRNCSSMTSIPSMYVYSGANYSHNGTFQGCTALTSASTLRIRGCNFYGFANTFMGCTALVTPPDFSEVTSMSGSYNFASMFSGCTSLVTAPTIEVTGLQAYCYQSMYYGCTKLKNPPTLPATTLKTNCYQSMFYGCTSLETAPDLPATTLASNCYREMFRNCSKLTFIKAMFTTTPSTSYTSSWVDGVSPTGIFVKNSEASWDVVGTYGVPTGWLIQNENAPVFVQRPTSPQIMLRRRAMLCIPPVSAYIQNGLMFHLDGIEKGNNAGAWTDLIGGKIFTNYGATSVRDGWTFDGVDDYMESTDDCTSLAYTETTTSDINQGSMEIVINRGRDTTHSPIIVFKYLSSMGSGRLRGLIIRTGDDNIQALTVSTMWNNASSDIPVNSPCTYSRSGNMTRAYVNYVSKDKKGYTNTFNKPNGNYIGRFSGSSGGNAYYYGKIMAIRLYNRQLSASEILKNQKIDNLRFGLGL